MIDIKNIKKSYTIKSENDDKKVQSLWKMLFVSSKNKKEVIALDDVSLHISEGEAVGVIGENGSGKSTLLSIIAGAISDYSGSCEVNGSVKAVLTLGDFVGEERTGYENIEIFYRINIDKETSYFEFLQDIENFSELGIHLKEPVRTYSSGMKARLAFSLITYSPADVLLLDEALSVGDVFFAEKAAARIQQLRDYGKVVIIVSHSMSAITSMCDRCIVMHGGKILHDGLSAEAVDVYRAAQMERKVLAQKRYVSASSIEASPSVATGTPRLRYNGTDWVEGEINIVSGECVKFEILFVESMQISKTYQFTLDVINIFDDTVFHAEIEDLDLIGESKSVSGVRCEIPKFQLSSGLFRLTARLTNCGGIIFSNSWALKVLDETKYEGGKPVYSSTIEVHCEKVFE